MNAGRLGTMMEIETKLAVENPADFDRLLAVLPDPLHTTDQLNLYLDTADLRIRTSKGSLRLRITGDRSWITLKQRIESIRPEVFKANEFEEETPREDAIAWVEQRSTMRPPEGTGFDGVRDLFEAGLLDVTAWSRTLRRAFDIGGGIVLEADETLFGDGTLDWELEIENADVETALSAVMGLARQAGVTLGAQKMTKHARAMAHAGDLPVIVPEKGPWPR